MDRIDLLRYSRLHMVLKPFYAGIGHALVFHRVCSENGTIFHKNHQVTPEYLENVLKYFISKSIDIVSLDECYERMTSKKRIKRFVVFTFDDGYSDNLTKALPIFEKYNAPFALFQTTGFPDHELVFWGYLLEELVLKNNRIIFSDGNEEYSFVTMTMEEKRNAFYNIRTYIRKGDKGNLLERLRAVFKKSEKELIEETRNLMLSWEQLKILSEHPLVTIGAHTVSHSNLKNLAEIEVMKEIQDSIQNIERITGNPVSYFAYPFGGEKEAGSREFNIVEQSNIKMAFTAINGNISKRHSHKLTSLPRIGLNENWSLSHIDLFINGFTPFINNFR